MRRHNILNLVLLMLSIINLAPAAPVAVRERQEERLNADVTRDVGAVSQKRWDSDDDGELPSLGLDHTPPPSPELADIMSQITHTRWSLPGSDHVLPPALSPGHSSLPPPSLGLEHLGSQIYNDPPTLNIPGSLPESDHMWPPVPNLDHVPPPVPNLGHALQPVPNMDHAPPPVPNLDHAPPPVPNLGHALQPVPNMDHVPLPVPNLDHAPPPIPDWTEVMSQIAHSRWSLPGSYHVLRPAPGPADIVWQIPHTWSSPGSDRVPRPVLYPADIMSQMAPTRWSLPGSDQVLPPAPSPVHLPPPNSGLENLGSQIHTDSPTLNSPGSLPGSNHMWPPVPDLNHALSPSPESTDIMSQIAHSRWSSPPGLAELSTHIEELMRQPDSQSFERLFDELIKQGKF